VESKRSTLCKWLRRAVICVIVVIGLWLLVSLAAVYWLTRRPHPVFAEPLPEVSWGQAQAFRLTTSDGEELGAWFFPGRHDRPLVLLLHGNRGCRRNCLPQAKIAAAAGCPALLISLRAHGDSTGEVNDVGFSARNDVIAAVAWLREKHPGRSVIVWGQSLGAAAAIFAAAQLADDVAGYILECPYQDLRTAVRNRTEYYLPPIVADVAYAGAAVVAPLVLPDVDRISPLEAASSIPESAHVLILAGDADRRARAAEARAIYERVRCDARLLIVPGGDHVKLLAADPVVYEEAALRLIGDCRMRAGRDILQGSP
jgi:alpha-beta hydrolase superfamily lysophospholipase